MKTKILLAICIFVFFTLNLTYAMWPQIDPHAEHYYAQSPYSFSGNNPVNNVDPDGKDYYQSGGSAVVWQDSQAAQLTIKDELYKNIGVSFSQQMVDGSFANYYQEQFISTSPAAVDARQTVLNNPGTAGALLSTDSSLSGLSRQGLMTDMIHQGQGNFIKGTADFGGTVLETTGSGLAVAGYAVSATGVGAGVGATMSGVGNGMARIGTGVRVLVNINEGNYGQIVVSSAGFLLGAGTSKIANVGSMGRETIKGGVNLFFTPMNTMVGNIKYKQK